MKKDKKTVIISSVAIALLLIILIGATYAYFKVQTGAGANVPTQVTTGTTDSLVFEVGTDISITADTTSFAEGMDNRTGTTFARATLRANNKTNSATGNYNLFFIIEANELTYTTEDNKPELLLKVTDPENNEITNIDGLSYKSVVDGKGNTVSGFDITTRTGGFKITKDYEITTNSEISQTWNIEVILVNLDSDQTSNGGKNMSGQLLITESDYETYKLAHVNTAEANITTDSITANLDIEEGTTAIDKYYFAIEEVGTKTVANPVARKMSLLANESDDNLKYYESNSNSYTFNNLKDNTLYKIYSYAIDKLGYKSNIYETEIRTEEYILPMIENVEITTITFNGVSVKVTAKDGTNEVVKYHYIKDNESYGEGEINSKHTYLSLSEQTQYNLKIKVEDSQGRFSNEYTKSITTPISLGTKCQGKQLGSCIASNYEIDGNIYHHTSSLANSAEDGSYRYAGIYEMVNNYVCFGLDALKCDNDHLYRIVGVFNNQIKLIKSDYATREQLGATGFTNNLLLASQYTNYKGSLTTIPTYFWSGSRDNKSNNWANSTLNTNALNKNFLETFSSAWQSKIVSTIWKIGGNNSLSFQNAPTVYKNEIVNPSTNTTISNKIGLIYLSDYMYGASPEHWLRVGYGGLYSDSDYRMAKNSNWIYAGLWDATITPLSRENENIYIQSFSNGYVDSLGANGAFTIRPSFYLNSTEILTGGSGTPSDPYRLS